jgi:AraC family transcriptional regulator, arabinose operon regulatory protein
MKPLPLINPNEILRGKQDNFCGDRSVVIPSTVLKNFLANSPFGDLYISDIGFYPTARYHMRQRREGIQEYILIYCIDGAGQLTFRGKDFSLLADTWFVIPAQEPHSYFADDKNPWSIYWVHFGGSRADRYQKFFGQLMVPAESNSSPKLNRITIFNELITALEVGFSAESLEYANMNLSSLLASFFYAGTFASVKGFHSDKPVDRAILFMNRNVYKSLKIKEISDYVGMSESHFSKIFRNQTGASPIDYFIHLKMQEAMRLLSNNATRVKEVAFALGYDDPLYFSRVFSRHTGMSPAAFAKRWC